MHGTFGANSLRHSSLRFIDLFAGLGGFHKALASLGHTCVFACEADAELARLYHRNFGLRPRGDIRSVSPKDVPPHDVLCAGFPCQNFSKAGDQLGLKCPQYGDLFDYIVDILVERRPRLLIMENVPNLMRHCGGRTWRHIREQLRQVNYVVSEDKLSPDMFGVPQTRERSFIVGRLGRLEAFQWPKPRIPDSLSIRAVLDRKPPEARYLEPHFIEYLDAWQDLISRLPHSDPLPTWPLWAMEWGANYPYVYSTPHSKDYKRLGTCHGSFGRKLAWMSPEEIKAALPPYAREEAATFPDWKIDFIRKNREFYKRHHRVIDRWLPRIAKFPQSFQKLEWNCKGEDRNIWTKLLQFRASGIRVKSTRRAPSLIAMTTSQVPVIAWERRYMTERECSRLQSLGDLRHLPESKSAAFRALGNAVNVTVVRSIAQELFEADARTSEISRGKALKVTGARAS
jgi:DNA (cytosine-5)-methyltransferase 1